MQMYVLFRIEIEMENEICGAHVFLALIFN